MTNNTAQPGDIFLLLVPSAQELHQLRKKQFVLNQFYGGKLVEFIHITCQRFSADKESRIIPCIQHLSNDLQNIQTFKIYTDSLIQFYAPYWKKYVLRWRVQETEPYRIFRDKLNTFLSKIGFQTHFNRQRHATCPILNLSKKINLESTTPITVFPMELFTAKNLWVSKLQADGSFEILSRISFQDQESNQFEN